MVINNHLIAAVCATVVVYAVVPIWYDGQRRVRYFVLAGFFGALMAAEELPALALFAAISLALLWKAPRQTLLAYVPAAMVVAIAFFATNWIAHGSLTIPYMHRGPGDNWYDYTYQRNGKEIESYWRHPTGIDLGEQSRASVCAARACGTSWDIFTYADLAVNCGGNRYQSLAGPGPPVATMGRTHRRRVAGLHSVLFVPATDRTQLRRHDQRFPLGVLACAVMAVVDAARCGLSFQAALDPGVGLGASNYFRLLGQLSHLESVDQSVDNGLYEISYRNNNLLMFFTGIYGNIYEIVFCFVVLLAVQTLLCPEHAGSVSACL